MVDDIASLELLRQRVPRVHLDLDVGGERVGLVNFQRVLDGRWGRLEEDSPHQGRQGHENGFATRWESVSFPRRPLPRANQDNAIDGLHIAQSSGADRLGRRTPAEPSASSTRGLVCEMKADFRRPGSSPLISAVCL
jgi:hypothetical protein